MHLKMLLQDGPKFSTDHSIGAQFAWNHEITDDHVEFKSFLGAVVGRDFPTQRRTFETILEKCDDWLQKSWKYLLLLLRIVLEYTNLNNDQRNDLKAMAKS